MNQFDTIPAKQTARNMHALILDLIHEQYSEFKKICNEQNPFFESWWKTPAKAFFDLMFLNYYAIYTACTHTIKNDNLYRSIIDEIHELVASEMGRQQPDFQISNESNFIVGDVVKLNIDLDLIKTDVEACTNQRADPNKLRSNLNTIFHQVCERRFRDLFQYNTVAENITPSFPIALVMLGIFLGVSNERPKGIYAREFKFIQSKFEQSYQEARRILGQKKE